MSPELESYGKAVRSLRRRIALTLVTRRAVAAIAVWAFLWGTLALAGRATALAAAPPLWAGLILLFGVIISVSVHALRAVPAWETLQAHLDARSRAGGLAMTGAAGWEASLPPPAVTRVRWKARRAGGLLLASLLYAAACLLVPMPAAASHRRLDVQREAERVAQDLRTLEEEKVVDEERASKLSEDLAAVVKEASGNDPVKTWEALDHLEQAVRAAARQAGEDAAAAAQRLSRAESLAGALAEDGAQLSPRELSDAMADLSRRVKEALGEGAESSAAAPRTGAIDSKELRDLAQKLGSGRQGKLEALRRLSAAGLIDGKTLKEAERAAGSGSSELAQYLSEHPGEGGEPKEEIGGRGGVTRGRGDAQMTWQYPGAEEEGAKFQERELPPAALAALKESRRVGMSRSEPEPAVAAANGGALAGAAAGGGSASKQPVLPRHRAAVKKYFERGGSR